MFSNPLEGLEAFLTGAASLGLTDRLINFLPVFTHIFTCFAQGLWGFLIAGALLFPIGILHGFYLWFF